MNARLRSLYFKELGAYFYNPAAYIVAIVFLLIAGYLFTQPLFLINQADIRPFTELAPLLLIFFVPAITMRLFAEEAKGGTLELLLTLPVQEWEVLASKFLAAVTLLAFTLALTAAYPISVAFLGNVDYGAIVGSYLGLLLTGALLAGAGVFASSLTRNQVVAFIIAFLISFALYLLGKTSTYLPFALSRVADFVGLDSHLDALSRGVVDTRDVVYYLTFTGFFLFLTQIRLGLARSD